MVETRIYSATYSNIPVYELQFGDGFREHVMRRRGDDWVNATHILKAAGFDKPTRTRILEREVQKERHEKIQGGYGKYQGTWVPLEQGQALAQRNHVYEKLRTIFEYTPGIDSPPEAPKHTTSRTKAKKRSLNSKYQKTSTPTPSIIENEDEITEILRNDPSISHETTPIASMNMNDRYEMLPQAESQRKRKRPITTAHEQAHILYSDELLDYFMLSSDAVRCSKPEPPLNFNPDWIIDNEGHTALHWAAAMGDVEVIKELKRYGANIGYQNSRGETPLMRCVMFINCRDKKTMPEVVNELIETVNLVDFCNSTVLHHTAAVTAIHERNYCAHYYLDTILNKIQEVFEPNFIGQIINAQDVEGNTALHIVAKYGDPKCIRVLIERNASINIRNNEGITVEDEIREIDEFRRIENRAYGSSSPYGIENEMRLDQKVLESQNTSHYTSKTALSIQSTIAPQLIERAQHLANCFDDELKEKEALEQEARRILDATIFESEELEQRVSDLQQYKESPEAIARSQDELDSIQKKLTSLVEHRHMLQLKSLCAQEHKTSKVDGDSDVSYEGKSGDELLERVKLSSKLNEEQKKRQALVQSYFEARSMVGGGEKSILYRKVLTKSLGPDVSLVDENLDILVKELKDNHKSPVISPID